MQVPFTPGRTDASQEQTDVESFAVLEPDADGFRNFLGDGTRGTRRAPADRARLQADAERARDDGAHGRPACPEREHWPIGRHGVLTKRPGVLTNDFFVNLLDMGTEWMPTSGAAETFDRPRPHEG